MARKSTDPIDIPTSIELALVGTEEAQEVSSLAGSITTFMTSVVAFFQTAQRLQHRAEASWHQAQRFPEAKDEHADAALQAFLKHNRAQMTETEAHWQPITSSLSALHKRFTGGRARGVDPHAQAQKHVQGLHNRYVDMATRRAQEEQARRDREAEAEAQRKRDADLADLAKQAEDAEANSPKLSDRETIFVELVATRAPFEAAKRAGFASPAAAAERLLRSPKIQIAIEARKQMAAAALQAEALKAAPLDVAPVETIARAVTKVGTDRTTWSGEILDAAATLEAYRAQGLGIPADLFQINPVKLNEYARAMRENLNRWPGVRAKKTTVTL